MDIDALKRWVGRQEHAVAHIAAEGVAALSATLDRADPAPDDGDALPPLWHWMYFNVIARHSELGLDGHAQRGGFLPPVDLPRRMWAGGRITFHAPIRIGVEAERTSEIGSVTGKEGKSGALVFVTVRHEIEQNDIPCLTEEHDIVYRAAPQPGARLPAGRAAPPDARWSRKVHANSVMLFRYSALTFNGHRIHYDHPYATQIEGYPGLIVHGPLMATLLVDLVRRERPNERIRAFEFRALAPVFDTHPFTVNGNPQDGGAALWIADHTGQMCMEATAHFAD